MGDNIFSIWVKLEDNLELANALLEWNHEIFFDTVQQTYAAYQIPYYKDGTYAFFTIDPLSLFIHNKPDVSEKEEDVIMLFDDRPSPLRKFLTQMKRYGYEIEFGKGSHFSLVLRRDSSVINTPKRPPKIVGLVRAHGRGNNDMILPIYQRRVYNLLGFTVRRSELEHTPETIENIRQELNVHLSSVLYQKLMNHDSDFRQQFVNILEQFTQVSEELKTSLLEDVDVVQDMDQLEEQLGPPIDFVPEDVLEDILQEEEPLLGGGAVVQNRQTPLMGGGGGF